MVIDRGGASRSLTERTPHADTLGRNRRRQDALITASSSTSDGSIRLSAKVSNDETALLDLIATVIELAGDGEICWATDLTDGGASLLIALLAGHDQQLLYIPGRIVHHAAATYRGDGKTDAKDARIIADQARMRTDLQPVRIANQVAVDLRLLTSHRLDVIHDRVRAINRLRAVMLEYFPALEREFDYSKNKAVLVLLSHYTTPESLRRIGATRLAAWLKARGCRNSVGVAKRAVGAAQTQTTTLPAQAVGSGSGDEAGGQDRGDRRGPRSSIDPEITDHVNHHDSAQLVLTMPGFGPVLAATFIAQIGGQSRRFRQRRPARLRRRPGTRSPRLRAHQREPAPAPTIQPAPPAHLLSRRALKSQEQPIVESVL